ncbi:helix-turn-helix domain-containing protein [Brucella intermedia]|uniref:helix-turn-helix domain-containing protein n=1 Tax=Brucella intermedia TaxID=94625 RepID=UPI00224A7B6F|nr:helix-turn-helix transcriptional regulator [Brucella intermedia]
MNGLQCKLARIALGLSVLRLAAEANVSTQTIVRLERGEVLRPKTLVRIKNVFEDRGIIFLADDRGYGILIKT